MGSYDLPNRPRPRNAEDIDRWLEQGKRIQMQEGNWRPYIERRMSEFFAAEVIARIYSGLDVGGNAFKLANEKKATLYDNAPATAFDATDAERRLLDLPRLWALSQWRHLVTNAANASLTRIDFTTEDGITYRTVTPDCVVVEPISATRPDVPGCVEELYELELPNGECTWAWEIFDVRDPSRPFYAILSGDRKEDLTPYAIPRVLVDPRDGLGPVYGPSGRLRNWYPHLDRNGWPILPYAMHHHRLKHRLWDWRTRVEIVEGTINAACLRSWYMSGLRDLAHPQRVGINVRAPAAANLRGISEPDRLTLDASAILMLESIAGQAPVLTTLNPAMDPAVALDSIERYQAGLLEGDGLGIEPSNTSRMSGYAIVVTRDSLRRVQRQQQPAALQGDRQILTIVARMLNAYVPGCDLPEDPEAYQIAYNGIEFSLEEIRSRIEQVTALRNARLMTRIDALLTVYPSLTPEDARKKLAEIDAEMAASPAAPDTVVATLTDPSSGAPMRTPRGIAQVDPIGAPDPEGVQHQEPHHEHRAREEARDAAAARTRRRARPREVDPEDPLRRGERARESPRRARAAGRWIRPPGADQPRRPRPAARRRRPRRRVDRVRSPGLRRGEQGHRAERPAAAVRVAAIRRGARRPPQRLRREAAQHDRRRPTARRGGGAAASLRAASGSARGAPEPDAGPPAPAAPAGVEADGGRRAARVPRGHRRPAHPEVSATLRQASAAAD